MATAQLGVQFRHRYAREADPADSRWGREARAPTRSCRTISSGCRRTASPRPGRQTQCVTGSCHEGAILLPESRLVQVAKNDRTAARCPPHTSPRPGRGASASTICKTSGPPYRSTTTRFIALTISHVESKRPIRLFAENALAINGEPESKVTSRRPAFDLRLKLRTQAEGFTRMPRRLSVPHGNFGPERRRPIEAGPHDQSNQKAGEERPSCRSAHRHVHPRRAVQSTFVGRQLDLSSVAQSVPVCVQDVWRTCQLTRREQVMSRKSRWIGQPRRGQ
jgi:hypothetical protein